MSFSQSNRTMASEPFSKSLKLTNIALGNSLSGAGMTFFKSRENPCIKHSAIVFIYPLFQLPNHQSLVIPSLLIAAPYLTIVLNVRLILGTFTFLLGGSKRLRPLMPFKFTDVLNEKPSVNGISQRKIITHFVIFNFPRDFSAKTFIYTSGKLSLFG